MSATEVPKKSQPLLNPQFVGMAKSELTLYQPDSSSNSIVNIDTIGLTSMLIVIRSKKKYLLSQYTNVVYAVTGINYSP